MDNRKVEPNDIISLVPKQLFLYLPLLMVPIIFLYGYVYFIAFNIKINQLPITFFDLMRQALNWMPEIGLTFYITYIINLLFFKYHTKNNKIYIFKNKFINFVAKYWGEIVCGLSLIGFAIYLIYSKTTLTPLGALCTAVILWSYIFHLMEINRKFRSNFSINQRVNIRSLLGLIIIVTFYGYCQGLQEKNKIKSGQVKSIVAIKETKDKEIKEKPLAYIGELGVIWYDKNKKHFQFATWENVKNIKLIDNQPLFKEVFSDPILNKSTNSES